MSQLSRIFRDLLYSDGSKGLSWHCEGCDDRHSIKHGPGGWAWNGNADKPTFTPSVLVRSGHHATGFTGSCWCTYNAEQVAKGLEPSGYTCNICHTFITDGMVQFLSDCTHHLAGKTVPMAPMPSRKK
jgi:hypothetical protein